MKYKRNATNSKANCKRSEAEAVKNIVIVVLSISLILLLASCEAMPERRTIKIKVPEGYVEASPVPAPNQAKISYMIETYIPQLQAALKSCHADKAAIRKWQEKEAP